MLRKGRGGLYKAPTEKERTSERLKGESDQIKFIDLRFERWQVVGLRKEKESKTFHIPIVRILIGRIMLKKVQPCKHRQSIILCNSGRKNPANHKRFCVGWTRVIVF